MWNIIIKRLYDSGKISEGRVRNAVAAGLISDEDCEQILAKPETEPDGELNESISEGPGEENTDTEISEEIENGPEENETEEPPEDPDEAAEEEPTDEEDIPPEEDGEEEPLSEEDEEATEE